MSIGTTLRNQVFVRLAEPDTEPVADWCQANSGRNAFDKDVLTYPNTKILAAHANDAVSVYLPVQPVAMLESVGSNPSATPLEVAGGLIEATKAACVLAYAAGHREVYFLSSDDLTAQGAQMLGFVPLPYTIYRKKL